MNYGEIGKNHFNFLKWVGGEGLDTGFGINYSGWGGVLYTYLIIINNRFYQFSHFCYYPYISEFSRTLQDRHTGIW